MGTYKIIQDIESEDKLLGPLSLRQFIYAIITLAIGFIAFTLGSINPLLGVPFLLPMGLFGLLAAPFGRDQSSEIWLLAKIRFLFKPRVRVWDQSGMTDYVQITVPKKMERYLTDGLDQTQVKSRLKALAETLDSRGWAVKNVQAGGGGADAFAVPAFAANYATGGGSTTATAAPSDRLVGTSTLPAVQPLVADAPVDDDILDEAHSPTAQKFDSLITQAEQTHRQNIIANMQVQADSPPQTPTPTTVAVQAATATDRGPRPAPSTSPDASEQQLLNKIHQDQAAARAVNSHTKRIPTAEEKAAAEAATAEAEAKEAARTEELKRLAVNDDLDIATIARQAHKDDQAHALEDGEVVISLH